MKYFLSLLLMIQMVQLTAQNNKTFSIQGKVLDGNGNPLPYAYVLINSLNVGTTTDLKGNYQLKKLPLGKHQLTAQMVGMKKQTKTIIIKNQALEGIDFRLKEDAQQMGEVIVRGKTEAQVLRRSAKSVNVIETRELKLQSADLGEVMAKSEGVSVQRAGGLGSNTRFALNGLSGDKIRFFYNGIPLNFTLYSFGIANTPVNAIKQIEVYKGVVPIQFGADALGGAINLVSPTPDSYRNDGWSGSASYQVGSFNTHRSTANLAYNNSNGLYILAGGFHDYTNNNYKIDVAIPNERGKLKQETVERFHDGYKAFGTNLKVGIRDKKWANELSVEGYYGSYYNEVQNSQAPGLVDYPELGIDKAVAGNPFGHVVFTSFSQGINLNYNVNLSKKWDLDLKAGYNYNERVSIDTSHNLYNWHGEVVRVQNQPGEFGEEDHLITKSQNYFARQQIDYEISEKHVLKLSLAPTYTYRTGDDLLIEGKFDPALDDGYLFDFVTGLEYRGDLFNEKLQIITFAKNYRQNIRIEGINPSVEGLQVDERSVSNYGAGSGVRYGWTAQFATKLSYEYAYRMPRQNEIFGDGQLIGKNLELGPENGQNVNFQWTVDSKAIAKTEWQIQGNFFVRRINNLIFLVVDQEGVGSFQNVWSASSQGLELGGRVKNLVKGLSFNANTTYQSYLNTSDEGLFTTFKGDRIPNTPYFFANGGAVYELTDVIQKNDRLSIFWSARYVHPFFIGWESAGLRQFKAETPSQFTHTVGITENMNIKNTQTSLTIEMQNLTNTKVFDLYGVQRPGRAFYVKLTTQF